MKQSNQPICPKCAAVIPDEAPGGLCPKCALEGAAAVTNTTSGGRYTTPLASGKWPRIFLSWKSPNRLGPLKVAVHRMRQKFGEAIRQEIAGTVETEEEIAGELRYLIEALQAR